jgi:hypothetical protein
MTSPAISEIIKIMEDLPESTQQQIANHLRDYIAELQDEQRWDEQFASSQDRLVAAARRARQQIAEG